MLVQILFTFFECTASFKIDLSLCLETRMSFYGVHSGKVSCRPRFSYSPGYNPGIIHHLGQISGDQVPGPIDGREPQGYLWGDDGTLTIFY